jgi:hypothetical protein
MLSFCPMQKDWVLVPLPSIEQRDPRWSSSDSFIFAAAFLSAKQFFSEERAKCIAEAIVYKQLLPGLFYDSKLESDIQTLYTHN